MPGLTYLFLCGLPGYVLGDVYLHNPRGSNNKLSEQSNNVANNNRLFDSQNNNAGGYQVGDNCRPVCQNDNNQYDATKLGAMQGVMTFYQGSELYIEWTAQHGCGYGHPNLHCQVILQYMTEADNPGLRDGTKRGGQNNAGGQANPPKEADASKPELGQHEPFQFYADCRARERNQGLYTADQPIKDNIGATSTRQDTNGQRHGLECPEERDYYPYWHPTPWHDIAVLTSEPNERCKFYQENSQNVAPKGFCSDPQYNNPEACGSRGAEWKEQDAFDEGPPACVGGISSRDNHLGNIRNAHPDYYLWTIPEHVSGKTVLRIRYNVSTMDFDQSSTINDMNKYDITPPEGPGPFFIDASFSDPDPGRRRRSPITPGRTILPQNPRADFTKTGRLIQLQVNSDQFGRTFEDRTHMFYVKERPSDVPSSARIINYNVRGRRGNIVQVYPAVEYDFVPADLKVEVGTYLHFQWTGSDANPQGNDGNGRAGTDRSNLVQVSERGDTVPLTFEKHKLLFDGESDTSNSKGRELFDRFLYLDQDSYVQCDDDENNENSLSNCKQLNGASAYFDGGLVEMTQVSVHHVASTRNNDFSNRSHKATITVTRRMWKWWEILFLVLGIALAIAAIAYIAVAWWAFKHPDSWMFGRRFRPRVLSWRWIVSSETIKAKEQERRRLQGVAKSDAPTSSAASPAVVGASSKAVSAPPVSLSTAGRWKSKYPCIAKYLGLCGFCLHKLGLKETRLFYLVYSILNVVVFMIGVLTHLDGGFQGSWGYPVAKGGGFMLDLNMAIIILPMLRSMQTSLRAIGVTREWLPTDDPLAMHFAAAFYIALGSFIHILGHSVNMFAVSSAPALQQDPLDVFDLTAMWQTSGRSFWSQLWNIRVRCAPVTGMIITILMLAVYITAMPCVRRGKCKITRRLGGFNCFLRVHQLWKVIYPISLVHAPERLWIWLFFPAGCILVDRLMAMGVQKYYGILKEVKLLSHDVIALYFEVPKDFHYQSGQYILLRWNREWHPFTITSAPEEDHLSVHIRASDSLDWCSALRRRLLAEAPAAVMGGEATMPPAGTRVAYTMAHTGHKVFCRPCASGKRAHEFTAGIKIDTQESESDDHLPPDAVSLKISGPHGAPAQRVWQFKTIMVVGSGIGITPFISVLRSVQMKAQQRHLISQNSRTKPNEDLLNRTIPIPRKIYFYWVVRSRKEFNWFHEILAGAVDGPAKSIVEIHLFATEPIEISQASQGKVTYATQQWVGRPEWNRIFKKSYETHKSEHIGVFLCGAPAIGAALRAQCDAFTDNKHDDATENMTNTRFSFFSEHF